MTLAQVLAIPEVQTLLWTGVAYVWLTHLPAALPPALAARLPAAVQALAGNWGNAKNTQAPTGPASPLASIALTALAIGLASLPALVPAAPQPAPVVAVPVPQGLALPVTPTTLPEVVTP